MAAPRDSLPRDSFALKYMLSVRDYIQTACISRGGIDPRRAEETRSRQGGGRRMNRTRHDVRSQQTRQQLVTAARALFGARGYADVGTEEIVRAAGVTRGALYHQFRDKSDLFAAVAEEVEAEIAARIASGVDEFAADLAGRYGLGLVRFALQAAIDAGTIVPQPVVPLSHILIGALNECALYVAQAEDPPAARKQ